MYSCILVTKTHHAALSTGDIYTYLKLCWSGMKNFIKTGVPVSDFHSLIYCWLWFYMYMYTHSNHYPLGTVMGYVHVTCGIKCYKQDGKQENKPICEKGLKNHNGKEGC